ncbi:MAG: hypothetical protein KA184_00805 [Candidatus Hydrogenedentes bacterium]|nr:hypothetical protein [Candidatus Hydrogenedentota bacterium]
MERTDIARMLNSPKLQSDTREKLRALEAHLTAAADTEVATLMETMQLPRLCVWLSEMDEALLPDALRRPMSQPENVKRAPGLGTLVSVRPTWADLKQILACRSVQAVELYETLWKFESDSEDKGS